MTDVGADKNLGEFEKKPSTTKGKPCVENRTTSKERWKFLSRGIPIQKGKVQETSIQEAWLAEAERAPAAVARTAKVKHSGRAVKPVEAPQFQAMFQVCSADVPTLQPRRCQSCVRLYEPAFPCPFLA